MFLYRYHTMKCKRTFQEYEATKSCFIKACWTILDKNNIIWNSGLRSVAKLCLNSFWRKFGQWSNLVNKYKWNIKNLSTFRGVIIKFRAEIIRILPVNSKVYVSWRLKREAVITSPIINVFIIIAAFTTQACLKLYEYLEKLYRCILYYDSDSCIHIYKRWVRIA